MVRTPDKEVVYFSNPSDRRLGFLSNESKHSFVLEDKRWPTVEHYIQAKKFDGTQYEEEIRKAGTVYQVKLLASPRKVTLVQPGGKVSKQTIYGKKNRAYSIREDWNDVKSKVMERAVRAKFDQNSRLMTRLRGTYNAKLIRRGNPELGKILMMIRDERMYAIAGADPDHSDTYTLKDIRHKKLTAQDKKIVEKLIKLSLRVSEMEGYYKVFSEMVEDAISIADKKALRSVEKFDRVWWGDILSKLPNTEKIIREIHKIFTSYDPFQEKQISSSKYLGGVIRWFHLEATKKEKDLFLNKLDRIDLHKISLPKGGTRWYRNKYLIPPRFEGKPRKKPKKVKPRKNKKTPQKVKPQKKKPEEPKIIITAKKLPPQEPKGPDNLTIRSDASGNFIVVGKPVKEHALVLLSFGGTFPKKKVGTSTENHSVIQFRGKVLDENRDELLSLGGKYPLKGKGKNRGRNTNVIQFQGKSLADNREHLEKIGGKYPRKMTDATFVDDTARVRFGAQHRKKVEEYVFSTLPDERKYFLTLKRWREEKITTFADTAEQTRLLLKGETIDARMINFAIDSLWKCGTDSHEVEPDEEVKKDIERILKKSKLSFSEEAKNILATTVASLQNILVSGDETLSTEELKKRIGDATLTLASDVNYPESATFSPNESFSLKALFQTALEFCDEFDLVFGRDVCYHSFLTILPPEKRFGGEKYLEPILRSYNPQMIIEDIANRLKDYGIRYTLEDIYRFIANEQGDEIAEDEDIQEETLEEYDICLMIFAAAVSYFSLQEDPNLFLRVKIFGSEVQNDGLSEA